MSRIADMLIEIEELWCDGYSPKEISEMSGIQLSMVLEALELYGVEWDRDEADSGDMDGDAASALASAGWGVDEDYGDFGTDEF